MQRWLTCLTAGGVVALLGNSVSAQIQVQAQAAVPFGQMTPPAYGVAPNRLASTDAIFVGRVVALEPMDIEASPAKGQPRATYRIAVIQVTEAVHGLKKDAPSVRVGFVVGTNVPIIQFQPLPGGALGGRRVIAAMPLQVGQDGLFFLTKHAEEAFFFAPTYQTFVNRQNNPNFESDVKSAKQICKVLDNPAAALNSQDKEERYAGAAVLVSKYRSNSTGLPMKQEAIGAAESKLILKAMAEGDWSVGRFNATVPSAYELFNQLGVTATDGYKLVNVRNQQDIMQSMQKWLADHADTYRIKKLVADPNAKAVPLPQAQPGVIRGGARILPAQGGAQVLPVVPPQAVPAPKNDR